MRSHGITSGLAGPDAVLAWIDWLRERYKIPYVPGVSGRPGIAVTAGEAAERAGRRAEHAARRAAQVAQRRAEVSRPGHRSLPEDAVRAATHASEAKVLAGEATERVAIGLLRAATAMEKCAADCDEIGRRDGDRHMAEMAIQYQQAAARYRRMAAEQKEIDVTLDLSPG